MKVYLNDKICTEIKTKEQLKAKITELEINAQKEGQVLNIFINGKAEDQIPFGIDEANLERIDLLLKHPLELVLEGLIDSISYLPGLKQGLAKIVVFFQEGNYGRGISDFSKAIEGLKWFHTLLEGMELYIYTLDEINLDVKMLREDQRMLSDLFSEINQTLENDDYVLLGDLIEYELIPIVEKWKNNILSILDELAEV